MVYPLTAAYFIATTAIFFASSLIFIFTTMVFNDHFIRRARAHARHDLAASSHADLYRMAALVQLWREKMAYDRLIILWALQIERPLHRRSPRRIQSRQPPTHGVARLR
jgi:hypothetical protein